MKKRKISTLLTGILSACIVTAVPTAGMMMTAHGADDNVFYGDANCDGKINMGDVVLIMQSLANSPKFGLEGTDEAHITRQGMDNADVSERGNGMTNMDALAIQKNILGLVQLPESYSPDYQASTQTTTAATTVQTTTTTEPIVLEKVNTDITLNGSSISVVGKYAEVSGSKVTISHSGTYNIKGTLNDGQICVDIPDETVDNGTVKLIFNGVNITGKNAPAILVQNAEKTSITIADGTENTITDGDNLYNGDFLDAAIIEAKDDFTIKGGDEGTGKLTVTANKQLAISCNNDLKFTGGTVKIETLDTENGNDAVKGKKSVTVKDAKLRIDSEGDGLKSSKGSVTIESGDVKIKAAKDAVQAETDIVISGGKVRAFGDRGLTAVGTVNISGGEVLATATDNQCETIQSTEAPTLMFDLVKEWKKNNPVAITTTSNDILFEVDTTKKFRYIIVSSDKFDTSTPYRLYVGGIENLTSDGSPITAGLPKKYTNVNNTDDAETLYGDFFDQSQVHTVDIKMNENDWNNFIKSASEEKYVPCDVVIDGETLENVGIRAKGNSSLLFVSSSGGDKFSFRFKLDEFDKHQNYHGLTEFCMNNMYSDPSCMRDVICYNAFYELKGYAPDVAYTDMTLNGQPYSFYLLCEQPGTTLAERFATDDEAVLYKASERNANTYCSFTQNMALDSFDVKFGKDDQYVHIDEVKQAINKLTSSNYKFIEDVIDVPSFLKGFAVNAVLCNYDSYNGSLAHNYYLMYNDGKMRYVGWDYNLALGNFMDYGASATSDIKTATYQTNVNDRPLLKLLQVPEYYDMYVGYVKEIVDMYSQPEQATAEIASLIRDHVKADPRFFFTADQFETNIAKSANGLQVSNNGGGMWGGMGGFGGGGFDWGGGNNGGGFDWGGGNNGGGFDWGGGNNGGGFDWGAGGGFDWGAGGGGFDWGGGGMGMGFGFGGGFSFGGDQVSIVDFIIKRNEFIHSELGI